MRSEEYFDRQERLRASGKVDLPLNIDTKKYLYGNISFQDVFVLSPFVLLGILITYLFYRFGILDQRMILIAFAPTFLVAVFQLNKHPSPKKFIAFAIQNLLENKSEASSKRVLLCERRIADEPEKRRYTY